MTDGALLLLPLAIAWFSALLLAPLDECGLVDLRAAVVAERPAGREVDEYDPGSISPNAHGQRVIADAFASAYARRT